MITLASLIILCTLGLGALLAVSLVNSRQTRVKRARQRVKMLKFRVDALEELAILLDRIVDNRPIVHHVYDEALGLLDTMQKLDPSATYLKAMAAHAQRLSAEFADQYGNRAINRAMESDAKIARAKQALNEAARILRQRQTRGQLGSTELDIYLGDLSWNVLFVEVVSLIGRGLVAMKREDTLGAFAFYKRAQNHLLQSDRRDDKRARLIKELNEMLGKTRLLPSPDLMPEAASIYQNSSEGSGLVSAANASSEDVQDETDGDNNDLGIDINDRHRNQPDHPAQF